MAQLIPDRIALFTGGDHMEDEVAQELARALPENFRIYRQVDWSVAQSARDAHGELDLVVVAPSGAVALLEVKAGAVEARDGSLFKWHGNTERDLLHQTERQRRNFYARLRDADLDPPFTHWLVLPQATVAGAAVAFPNERIVDSQTYPGLAQRLRELMGVVPRPDLHSAVCRFLENKLDVAIDVDALHEQLQLTWRRIADGLATWVPRIEAPSGVVRVAATAGSGKTQLALALLRRPAPAGQRTTYVCFNRVLADHMAQIAPPQVRVASFHELCWDEAVRRDALPDWSHPDAFAQITAGYIQSLAGREPDLDLLVIDEAQDLRADWVAALIGRLRPQARLYVLEDPDQRLNPDAEEIEITDAVTVRARENYRSPRQVVETINLLGLASDAVIAMSPWPGEPPEVQTVDPAAGFAQATEHAVRQCIASGHAIDQIAVVSFASRKRSRLLAAERLGPWRLRKFSGRYGAAGEPLWSEGELLIDTVRRIKGRAFAAVVLTEIHFDELDEITRRLLFVGFTRATMRLELVMSEQAAHLLAQQVPD